MKTAARIVTVALALLLGSISVAAEVVFPPDAVTDLDKGEWIKNEADRVGVRALAAAKRRPIPERELASARARLEEMRSVCADLGRSCSDGATFITYYVEKLDEVLGAIRYRRAVEAKKLPKDMEEAMIARKAWVGMPADLLRMSWGEPARVTETLSASGRSELWTYGSGQQVILVNGRVTSITQSR